MPRGAAVRRGRPPANAHASRCARRRSCRRPDCRCRCRPRIPRKTNRTVDAVDSQARPQIAARAPAAARLAAPGGPLPLAHSRRARASPLSTASRAALEEAPVLTWTPPQPPRALPAGTPSSTPVAAAPAPAVPPIADAAAPRRPPPSPAQVACAPCPYPPSRRLRLPPCG
eukprot:339828-Chlamydomonas_euryale.AAC.1